MENALISFFFWCNRKEKNGYIQKISNDIEKCIYNLKPDDKLEFPFSKLVHVNGAVLAACIKKC